MLETARSAMFRKLLQRQSQKVNLILSRSLHGGGEVSDFDSTEFDRNFHHHHDPHPSNTHRPAYWLCKDSSIPLMSSDLYEVLDLNKSASPDDSECLYIILYRVDY